MGHCGACIWCCFIAWEELDIPVLSAQEAARDLMWTIFANSLSYKNAILGVGSSQSWKDASTHLESWKYSFWNPFSPISQDVQVYVLTNDRSHEFGLAFLFSFYPFQFIWYYFALLLYSNAKENCTIQTYTDFILLLAWLIRLIIDLFMLSSHLGNG